MKLTYIILGGIAAIAAYMVITSLPDIVRYQRIREM